MPVPASTYSVERAWLESTGHLPFLALRIKHLELEEEEEGRQQLSAPCVSVSLVPSWLVHSDDLTACLSQPAL
jgi:hypothetical protein